MNENVEPANAGAGWEATRAAPTRLLEEHVLAMRFTGSGSEYFRIWTVNLLLTLVTLGLYYPFAKVRRLRYFYGNTELDGHAFDFHGNPWRMLRGFLLVAAMLILYSIALRVSTVAAIVAIVLVGAIWPALFRASLQFRLANTSWRGLRLRFVGDLAGAYKAMLPLFLPALLVFGTTAYAHIDETAQPTHAQLAMLMTVSFLPLLLLPWVLWAIKKYQHDHYAIGQIQTQLRAGPGSFYGLFLKTLGLCLLVALVGVIVSAAVFGTLAFSWRHAVTLQQQAAMISAMVFGVFAVYGASILVGKPYVTSRLQNLLWNRTASHELRFDSALRFWPLLRLTLKNWLLILVTLGLYWPFAAIAMTRLRIEAVRVHSALAPDELASQVRVRADDATGDAAGDLFGIDVGL